MELEKLQVRMEDIAGQWNGDESGIQENNAIIAEAVVEKIKEIRELIEEII